MKPQDPYQAPPEVPQPRGISGLAWVGILVVTAASVAATFVGTCFPIGLLMFDSGGGAAIDAIAWMCGFVALVVGFAVARGMVRRQRLRISEEFHKRHGG